MGEWGQAGRVAGGAWEASRLTSTRDEARWLTVGQRACRLMCQRMTYLNQVGLAGPPVSTGGGILTWDAFGTSAMLHLLYDARCTTILY